MSNLNTTTAVAVAAPVAVPFLNVDFKPEGDLKVKAMPYGKYAMREIVKGLRATEKGNKSNVIHHTGQVIETLARVMRHNAAINYTPDGVKDGKAIPAWVEAGLRDTLREVIVAMIKAGDAPYLNCGVTMARLNAMPRKTVQQINLWDYQCRKLADATLFMNGQAVEKPKGKYLPESMKDAKSKEVVESVKILRNYTNKIVTFLYNEHAGVIREFAFRNEPEEKFQDFDAADVETIAALIETKAPGGMSDLAHAFRKPQAPQSEKSAIERLLESFAKLTKLEDRAAFLKLANAKHAEMTASAVAAEASVNKGDADADADDFSDLRNDNDADDGGVEVETAEVDADVSEAA